MKNVATKSTVKKRCIKENENSGSKQENSHKRLRFDNSTTTHDQNAYAKATDMSQLLEAEKSSSSSCADFIVKSCPIIIKEIEKLILENIKTKADALCSRKEESSIFYHKDYDSLVDLNFESILGELCENFSGKFCK